MLIHQRRRRSQLSAQGCVRQRATLGKQNEFHRNPEGVAASFGAIFNIRELFQSSLPKSTPFPRALPWAGICERLRRW